MDWYGRFLRLPEAFLNCSEGPGGGVMQGSASEAILVAMLTAREQSVQRLKMEHPELGENDIRGKLIMYSSRQSNSAVEKMADSSRFVFCQRMKSRHFVAMYSEKQLMKTQESGNFQSFLYLSKHF